VTDRFQDGCRRHVGNSSECHKMGKYHPILMKIGTQTKKNMLSLKVTIPEVTKSYKNAKKFYSPAEASLLIQHVVMQS
jgi:hypothetical protein